MVFRWIPFSVVFLAPISKEYSDIHLIHELDFLAAEVICNVPHTYPPMKRDVVRDIRAGRSFSFKYFTDLRLSFEPVDFLLLPLVVLLTE